MGKTERIGVSKVQLIVSEDLGWVFREQKEEDYGIDAQIEVRGKTYLTGKLLGVQIKAGKSYFSEFNSGKIIYRFNAKHYNYWCNSSLNVILVLYSPSDKTCIWEILDTSKISRTSKGNYKISICKTNYFNKNAKNKLLILAYNKNIKELAFAATELFDTPQDIRSLYSELDDVQKDIFEKGLIEFLEKNVTYYGLPIEIDGKSLNIIKEITSKLSSPHYSNETEQNNEKIFIGNSFNYCFNFIKNFLRQTDNDNLLVIGMAGVGKSTLVTEIYNNIQVEILLINGYSFPNQFENKSTKLDLNNINAIIFDGWDEVPPQYKERAQRFLTDIMQSQSCKVVITSRYFPKFIKKEINTLQLEPLTDNEIRLFLKANGINDNNNAFENLRIFNTPALLQQVLSISKNLNLPVENITPENIIYANFMHYSSEQINILKNLAFNMFEKKSYVLKLNQNEIEILKKYKEITISNGCASFIHISIYEFFLAYKIYDNIFYKIDEFETNIIEIFSYDIPSVKTFEYLKLLINRRGVSNKELLLINKRFVKMLETGNFIKNVNHTTFFETISNIFYSVWHITLYINKHFSGVYKLNKSNNTEKNLTCLIDIFNRCYFNKKYLDFSNIDMTNFKLWRCNAININFKNSILKHANFRFSQLEGSNFENADMTECQLVGANLQHANLRNTNLQNANVTNCIISELNLNDILQYENSLIGLDSLIINRGHEEYLTYSQYKKSYT